MNERIKQLAVESYNPYTNFDHEKFAQLIIKDIFDIMNDKRNYNRCTYTTHDLDKAQCVVQELVKSIDEKFKTEI
jgi:hypothetical protein